MRSKQAQDAKYHGGCGGHGGGHGRPPGACHCRKAVIRPCELISVSGDQQERIVCACTEDQDGQNSTCRFIPLHSQCVQQAWVGLGDEAVCQSDDCKGEEPQERRAVRKDKEDRNDGCGDGEKLNVRAGKHAC